MINKEVIIRFWRVFAVGGNCWLGVVSSFTLFFFSFHSATTAFFYISSSFQQTMTVTVPCNRCGKSVSLLEAREVPSLARGMMRYECFSCSRKPSFMSAAQSAPPVRKKYYCQHCNYYFHAKQGICPYCNGVDDVIEGNVTVQDLL